MKRPGRLAAALVTLAMHLLAPVGAYAAAPPSAAPDDYCSAAARFAADSREGALAPKRTAVADSGIPPPRSSHSTHVHCPSCPGASIGLARVISATSFAVRPLELVRVPAGPVRADTASQLALLPPLRGPPAILL